MLWLKAFHVIAVIAWMAGLLYLPRLFVYHAGAVAGSELSETLKIMERRLLRIIMNPAMLAVWISGALLAWRLDVLSEPWFLAKLALVAALTWYHMQLSVWRKRFAGDANRNPTGFFRAINEVPTVLMALIVVLVIVKPI